MANFGNLSLTLAFTFTIYASISLLLGARTERKELSKSGERAVYVSLLFITFSVLSLLFLLGTSNFRIEYVANYTNRDLPLFYKLAALWGGQKGSLLLWTWLLLAYSTIVAYQNRNRRGALSSYALSIMAFTGFFFLILNKFAANPFGELVLEHGDELMPYSPEDGRGLNPLLQHPAMVVHPPILYFGYVGFVVPFAFAMGALIARELGNTWIKITRRWTLIAWFFLGSGILLGAKWAYVELGWGGYWAWDPVENASLMPWLSGTAFLHSVIVQEKKDMLKVWNVTLIIATYLLCIFGTFITRSGIVSSVHAFAKSPIGAYFVSFIALVGVLSASLVFSRLRYLKSQNELDSLISRESSFLFNNLVLLGACFAVLWGTIFPVISEALQGEKITVGAPFFNKINIPVGLFLLFLTGVGPLLAWRKTSYKSLRKNFILPLTSGVLLAFFLFLMGMRSTYALMAFALGLFVIITILLEFYRGARARMKTQSEHFLEALFRLTARNKRRYGGYIVHFGVVLLFVGFTGSAFNRETHAELKEGEAVSIKNYTLACERLNEGENPNYYYMTATLSVLKDGKTLYTVEPEKRWYKASEQSTSEVSIKSTLKEDLYVVFAGMSADEDRAVIQVYLNPLVSWVWIGGIVLALGTIITILPETREAKTRRARKEIEKLLRAAVNR